MMDEDLGTSSKKNVVSQAWSRLSQIYQSWLDHWTPYTRGRWLAALALLSAFTIRIVTQQWYQGVVDGTVPWTRSRWAAAMVLLVLFVARVIYTQGWYIVTYALGIYHLNLFISFLTPKIDPAMDFDAEENGPSLPTRANEEFRPFIRRLPEFKFWYSVSKSTLLALFCTFFDCFNVPVFWPILVMYFITLFCITMKRQIKHMIKYRYLPFTHGKPRYQHHEENNGSNKPVAPPK